MPASQVRAGVVVDRRIHTVACGRRGSDKRRGRLVVPAISCDRGIDAVAACVKATVACSIDCMRNALYLFAAPCCPHHRNLGTVPGL
ncbi:hypothetical protein [Xanthomonas sp. 3058]|uniref:hypothetical protein n=1 Tax=Xanthomonas sp. 3058 TaxID=3035314 RepID=UPI00160E5C5C|nr:hypothetical protein [Xanthomonas sp. 3058]MBB5865152.1 hypothetical protein [Xanthomonas sp. 3058]